jgi:hypothetical protein
LDAPHPDRVASTKTRAPSHPALMLLFIEHPSNAE